MRAMIAVAAGLLLGTSSASSQTFAFVDATVIPMDRERTIERQTVVVTDGRIVAMGPTASTRVPSGARVINARGKYLMPGLAEMHAHVPPQRPADQLLRDIMYLYVANGVTTIRGMLGAPYQLELRERLRSGEVVGPRFYVGAPSLNGQTAQNPATSARLMREHKAAGYDLVKVHPGISRATYDSAVIVGRQVGITLGGHVPADVGISHAIASRQSTIEHLDGYIEGASSAELLARAANGGVTLAELWTDISTDRLRALARETKQAQVSVVPTMYLWENLWMPPQGEAIEQRPEMRYVPRPWVDGWKNQMRGRAAANQQAGVDADAVQHMLARRRELLKLMSAEGVEILMGTDSPQMLNVPGFALHHEIKVMAASGMTPWEVLSSGTRNVAAYVSRVLGQPARFGTVAVGNDADLVLLDANPLQSIDNLQRRAGVMVQGRWHEASALAAGLEEIAARNAGS